MPTSRENGWFPIVLFVHSVAIAILVFSPATLAAPLAVNPCPSGMVLIPGGTFTIGSDDSGFVEERAATGVTLKPFCIDTYEITNAQFTEFVKATGYVTIAERSLSKEQFPDLPDEQRSPGSLVFQMAQAKQVSWLGWWHWTPGREFFPSLIHKPMVMSAQLLSVLFHRMVMDFMT